MSAALVKAGLAAVGIATLLWLVSSSMFRVEIPFVLVLALVVSVVASYAALARMRLPTKQAVLVREYAESPVLGLLPDRPFAGARRWEYLLDGAREEPALFATTVRPELVRLVDERLRLTYHIDRADDPERARAAAGPVIAGLWDGDRVLTQAELDNILEEMEKLWATPR